MNVLLGQLLTVKPVTPAQVLADERYGHCCLVGVQLGHVEVVHKIHQLLVAWRSIVDTSLQTEGPQLAAQGLLPSSRHQELASRASMENALHMMLMSA